MKLPALYIGRFQPFHLGHLDAMMQIVACEPKIIIAIGSAEDFGTAENPWTASERYQMIESALRDAGVKRSQYVIIPVRDIHNDAKWVEHVRRLVPKFGAVYTGSPDVKKLFLQAGCEVRSVKKNLKISGTMVREKIRSGKNWEKFVPPAIISTL